MVSEAYVFLMWMGPAGVPFFALALQDLAALEVKTQHLPLMVARRRFAHDPGPVRWDIAQGIVQHLDVECRPLQKFRLAQLLEAGVTRHGEIGAVELQNKSRLDDRFVFLAHSRGYRFDIGLVRRVIAVVLEYRHQAGRGGGDKPFDGRDLGKRVAEIGEVLGERLAVIPSHRTDAYRAPRHVRTGHPLIGGEKIRVVPGVEPRLGRLMAGKPREPVGDIGGVAGLRHLAVIDDVDAGLHLAADDVEDRLPGQASRALSLS